MSYGRRKRREDEKQGGVRMKREAGDDLLLANAIHILDKLQFLPGEEEDQGGDEEEVEGNCSSSRALLPVSLVAAVFLLLQAISSFMP